MHPATRSAAIFAAHGIEGKLLSPHTGGGTAYVVSDALHEIHNARVWGGIHWRTACLRGSALGEDVASWVMTHAMRDHGDQ